MFTCFTKNGQASRNAPGKMFCFNTLKYGKIANALKEQNKTANTGKQGFRSRDISSIRTQR